MSRKAAIVEEFDDDTDLPLPSNPLPNTGSRGPLLQELHISDDEFEAPRAGPASQSQRQPFQVTNKHQSESDSGFRPDATRTVTDITPYKTYVHLNHCNSSRLIILQMDMYIPHLSRRETPLWHR
jgi:signal recognition particle subunit SRP19